MVDEAGEEKERVSSSPATAGTTASLWWRREGCFFPVHNCYVIKLISSSPPKEKGKAHMLRFVSDHAALVCLASSPFSPSPPPKGTLYISICYYYSSLSRTYVHTFFLRMGLGHSLFRFPLLSRRGGRRRGRKRRIPLLVSEASALMLLLVPPRLLALLLVFFPSSAH